MAEVERGLAESDERLKQTQTAHKQNVISSLAQVVQRFQVCPGVSPGAQVNPGLIHNLSCFEGSEPWSSN